MKITLSASHIRIAAMALACFATNAIAYGYDLECTGKDGNKYYFNIISSSEAEVTYCDSLPRGQYEGQIEIPGTVESDKRYEVVAIGEGAFCNCADLEKVILPSSITRIANGAFSWCYGLKEFTLPTHLQELAPYAFQGCTGLVSFAIDGTNPCFTVSDGVLYNADGSQLIAYPAGKGGDFTIPSSVKSLAEGSCYDSSTLTGIHIPLSVTEIKHNAFYNCNSISNITIPADVERIGRGAFGECSSLKQFNVSADNKTYRTDNHAIYTHNGTLSHFAPSSTSNYTVASDTREIGPEAFFRNYQLESLLLPEGLETIGELALAECWNLSSLELPSTVKSIGFGAFALCEGIKSIYSHIEDPEAIKLDDCAFHGIDNEQCILYVPYGSREKYENAPQWKDFENISEYASLLDQQIIWTQSLDGLSAGDEIWLEAYASSSLNVNYTITKGSQRAFLIDSKLLILEPGAIEIEARQEGNGRFRPAVPVTRTINATADLISAEGDYISILGCQGFISIKGAPISDVASVYTIDGRLVYKGLSRTIIVPAGIYVVALPTATCKVIVK